MILKKIINALPEFVGHLGGFSIGAIMVLTSIDVFLRYLFNSPIIWAFEVTEYLMVACVWLGLAYTDTLGGHIGIDFILPYFPPKVQKSFLLLGSVLMLFLMVIFTWQGWVQFEDSLRLNRRSMGVTQTPVAPSQFLLFIGGIVFCIQLINKITNLIRELSAKSKSNERNKG